MPRKQQSSPKPPFDDLSLPAKQREIDRVAAEALAIWIVVERAVRCGARSISGGLSESGEIFVAPHMTPDARVTVGHAGGVPLRIVSHTIKLARNAHRTHNEHPEALQRAQRLARAIDVEPLIIASLEQCAPVAEA